MKRYVLKVNFPDGDRYAVHHDDIVIALVPSRNEKPDPKLDSRYRRKALQIARLTPTSVNSYISRGKPYMVRLKTPRALLYSDALWRLVLRDALPLYHELVDAADDRELRARWRRFREERYGR